jgi:hypothetical protein
MGGGVRAGKIGKVKPKSNLISEIEKAIENDNCLFRSILIQGLCNIFKEEHRENKISINDFENLLRFIDDHARWSGPPDEQYPDVDDTKEYVAIINIFREALGRGKLM